MRTTERDEVFDQEAVPHSAVPDDAGEGHEATNARSHAGAREDSRETAQSPPHSAVAPRDRFYGFLARLRGHVNAALAWVQATFTPPDIWSKERPSLRQIWEYAAHGEWTTPDGTPRNAGRAYAMVVALPGAALGYSIQWVTERFTRLAGTGVLLFLLSHIPPLSWLL